MPAGTPPEIVKKLFEATIAAAQRPEVKAMLAREGTEVALSRSPEEFAAFLAKDSRVLDPAREAIGSDRRLGTPWKATIRCAGRCRSSSLAGVCFSTLDATAKYLVQDHTLFLVVWARYAGQMLVTTPIAWHRAGSGFWRTRHLRMQLARSVCLVIATAVLLRRAALPAARGRLRHHLPRADVRDRPVDAGAGRAADARALALGDRRIRRAS